MSKTKENSYHIITWTSSDGYGAYPHKFQTRAHAEREAMQKSDFAPEVPYIYEVYRVYPTYVRRDLISRWRNGVRLDAPLTREQCDYSYNPEA